DCRCKLKKEIGTAKDTLATDGVFIAAVTKRLRDKNFRVRILASESLLALACPAAVAPLLQVEDRESSREVRRAIRSGLLSFPESCLPEFLRLRSSYLAHQVLIHMGRPAVEPLCELLGRVPAEGDIASLVS